MADRAERISWQVSGYHPPDNTVGNAALGVPQKFTVDNLPKISYNEIAIILLLDMIASPRQ